MDHMGLKNDECVLMCLRVQPPWCMMSVLKSLLFQIIFEGHSRKENRDTKFQSSNLKKQFHLKKVCVTVWKLTAEYIICTYAAKNSWHIVVSHTKTYEGWCYTECFHFPMSSRRSLSIRRNRIHGATGLSSWDGSTQFSKEMWHCIYHTSTFGTERAGIFTVIPLGIKALIHMAIFPQV